MLIETVQVEPLNDRVAFVICPYCCIYGEILRETFFKEGIVTCGACEGKFKIV